jgi:hypothetical protein
MGWWVSTIAFLEGSDTERGTVFALQRVVLRHAIVKNASGSRWGTRQNKSWWAGVDRLLKLEMDYVTYFCFYVQSFLFKNFFRKYGIVLRFDKDE